MRRVLILVFALLVLGVPAAGALAAPTPEGPTAAAEDGAGRQEPRCFDKKATVIDHEGAIKGTSGDDVIIGDDGDNEIDGRGGFDRICSGAGADRIVANAGTGNQFTRLFAQGGAGDDQLVGSSLDDQLVGGDGDDQLTGSQGDDFLSGGAGKDNLSGGTGVDFLDGGRGRDDCAQEATDDFFNC